MKVINSLDANGFYYAQGIDSAHSIEASSYTMHAHEMNEIYYVISGSGTYVVEGVEYPLIPGLLLIMRDNEAHMPKVDSSQDYERVSLHFRSSFVDRIDPCRRLLTPFSNRPIGCLNRYDNNLPHMESVRRSFQRMAEAKGELYEKELKISIQLYSILGEINQAFEGFSDREFQKRDGIIYELLYYIDGHLQEKMSLAALQKRFFISKTHLNRMFKQATGSTVWDYIKVKRLNLARQMLREGAKAKNAAYSCGFEEYSSFFKAYRQHYGVTPAQDRLKNFL